MHPEVAAKGSNGKEAFGDVGLDFGIVFAYTESPPLPMSEHQREPTCEDWKTAGEDEDAAYLARAGWPYHYLSQGLEAMNEVCANVEARGLVPALGYLLCLSAPTEAGYVEHLSKEQRLEVVRGLGCGENARPLHNERREPSAAERQESQTQEAEHKEEEAKEEREKYREPAEGKREKEYAQESKESQELQSKAIQESREPKRMEERNQKEERVQEECETSRTCE